MSSTAMKSPVSFARPRPGVVKTLGISNIVFAILLTCCLFSSMSWIYVAMMQSKPPQAEVQITAVVPATPTAPTAPTISVNPAAPVSPAAPVTPKAPTGRPMTFAINPFVGMDDPALFRFSVADVATSLVLNGLMFATGIGLINLKRWGARWWTVLAWIKIARLWVFWGYFIVVVGPTLSVTMAKAVIQMFQQQGGMPGRTPTLGEFTRVYSIMCLIMGVCMIVFGSIYPAISIWLLGRPGVKAALVGKTPSNTEPELL